MSVVNVKVAYIRPTYDNLKKWIDDENNIYIGRKGIVFINGSRYPPVSSIWHNPFKEGKDGTRDEIIDKYETYIRQKLVENDTLKNELLNLKNKNLGCWCSPKRCHGEILLKIIKELE